MKHIKTRFSEYIKESKVHLIDVFGDYPDENEIIWNYVGQLDFDHAAYEVVQMDINQIITPEFIENFEYNAEKWQRRLVNDLVKNIDEVKDSPIVYDPINKIVVDGNHKLMAMYLAGVKTVNIIDISEDSE